MMDTNRLYLSSIVLFISRQLQEFQKLEYALWNVKLEQSFNTY